VTATRVVFVLRKTHLDQMNYVLGYWGVAVCSHKISGFSGLEFSCRKRKWKNRICDCK
jgi:hypothetical protein